MSEGSETSRSIDPLGPWKQWSETSSKMWSNAWDGSKETYANSYGLYQSWLKSIADTQEQMKVSTLSPGLIDPKEVWKQWFDATQNFWNSLLKMGADPLGLTTQWGEMMEEARANMLAADIFPADPFTFFLKWYDATSEIWAKVVGDVIGSEKFIESIGPFLESYASFYKTARRTNEQYFKNLQLPTRSDLARLAELIIAQEEKVDRIEDALENFQDNYAHVATSEAVEGLAGRLNQVESKLGTLPASFEKSEGAVEGLAQRLGRVEGKLDTLPTAFTKSEEAVRGLAQHLDHVEGKLDTLPASFEKSEGAVEGLAQRLSHVESKLDTLPAALEKIEAVGGLAQRLNQVEGKLDTLLTSLARIEAKGYPERAGTVDAASPKRSKKNANVQEQEAKSSQTEM